MGRREYKKIAGGIAGGIGVAGYGFVGEGIGCGYFDNSECRITFGELTSLRGFGSECRMQK